MSHSQKLLTAVLVGCVVALTSCGAQHDDNEKFVLVANNLPIPYWQAAAAGFTQAAAPLRVKIEIVGPDTFDPAAEQQAFQRAVQQKATGILVSVADPKLLQDDIDKAIAAGIPVITIDSDAPASKRLFSIGTNNYEAGLTGAKRLIAELKGKGNVVVFTMPEQTNLAERLKGYRDGLDSHSMIKIIQVVDIKGDPRVAFDTTTTILGDKKQHVDGFVCLEALAGKEVAAVLNNNKVTDRVVIAMDTDVETLDWIQKNVIAATIAQKPYTMAFVGMRMLDELYHHKVSPLDSNWSTNSFAPIPAYVDTGSTLVDKSNLEAFQQAKKSVGTSGQK